MTDWPRYESHKVVRAAKIVERFVLSDCEDWRLDTGDTLIPVPPELLNRVPVNVDPVGGYVVEYSDGFISWSPGKAFEEGYTPVQPKDSK